MKLFLKLFFLFLFSYSFINANSNLDLLESASKGDLEKVKIAISKNADINYQDSVGTSALMFAANNNHFPIVKYLVDQNADVLGKNTSGWTAAVMAGIRGNLFIKEFLEKKELTIKKSYATGIVLSVIGNVFVDNKQLKVGDRILENQTVFVGKQSTCDIQVKQSLSEFTVRLKQQTVFSLKFKEAPEENIYSGLVKLGNAIFKVKKTFSGERIQALSPTIVASVRGTLFEVLVDKEGNTKVNVLEGTVRVRVRADQIEENQIIENTPEIKKLISNLDHNAKIVSSGQSIEVTQKKQSEILDKADAEGLKNRALRKDFSTAPIPLLTLRCSEKPSMATIDENELNKKLENENDLIGIEAAKLKNSGERPDTLELIESRKEVDQISNFQPETLKYPETIILKNGYSMTGSIYKIRTKYIIFSDLGKQVINEEDVEGFKKE